MFYQRASRAVSEGSLSTLVENVFRMLVIIGMFPILILTIVGSDVFTVIFGSAWTEAGVYAQILSLWAFIWFISSPLSTIYLVVEEHHFGFSYNFFQSDYPLPVPYNWRHSWKRPYSSYPFFHIRYCGVWISMPENDALLRGEDFKSPENSIFKSYPLHSCRNSADSSQNRRNKPDSPCCNLRTDYLCLLSLYIENR